MDNVNNIDNANNNSVKVNNVGKTTQQKTQSMFNFPYGNLNTGLLARCNPRLYARFEINKEKCSDTQSNYLERV